MGLSRIGRIIWNMYHFQRIYFVNYYLGYMWYISHSFLITFLILINLKVHIIFIYNIIIVILKNIQKIDLHMKEEESFLDFIFIGSII